MTRSPSSSLTPGCADLRPGGAGLRRPGARLPPRPRAGRDRRARRARTQHIPTRSHDPRSPAAVHVMPAHDPRRASAITVHPTHAAAPRRHGRVLRVGRAARRPDLVGRRSCVGGAGRRVSCCAASYAARRLACTPRCRCRRRAGCARTVVVIAPDFATAHGRVGGDHGDLPRGHAAGGAALARRGVPRRPRRPAPLGTPGEFAEHCAPPPTTAGRRLFGRFAATVSVAKLASARPSPTAYSSCRRPWCVSSTRSRSVSSGVGETARGRHCSTGSACSPSATSRTPRSATLSARSACTGARAAPPGVGSRPGGRAGAGPRARRSMGPTRPSPATPTTSGGRARAAAALGPGGGRLRRPRAGRTITLKVRFADFTTITPSRPGPRPPTWPGRSIGGRPALDALGLQRARIRLVGVRVEGLEPRATVHRQLVLGEPDPAGPTPIERSTGRLVGSAGRHVRPASLVGVRARDRLSRRTSV